MRFIYNVSLQNPPLGDDQIIITLFTKYNFVDYERVTFWKQKKQNVEDSIHPSKIEVIVVSKIIVFFSNKSIFCCRYANFSLISRFLSSEEPATKKSNSLEFNNSYSENQEFKILSTVNYQSDVELESYNISKARIRKISLRKQKMGNFKKVEEILELDGFGVKVLEKFCDSILKYEQQLKDSTEANESQLVTKKKQQFVSPLLLENVRKSITSCVSLHMDLSCIAWTKFKLNPKSDEDPSIKSISIEDWNCFEIADADKKLSLTDLIQILLYINNKLPTADSYVIEAQQVVQQTQPGNPVQINVNVQKSQLIAMMSILLASRDGNHVRIEPDVEEQSDKEFETEVTKKKSISQQRLFLMRHFLASRLHKTYIGAEKVSTEHVIENILRYNYTDDQPESTNFNLLDVPQIHREMYNDAPKVHKEYLGQSLLVGLTFLKLCVQKCSQSLSVINSRGRN